MSSAEPLAYSPIKTVSDLRQLRIEGIASKGGNSSVTQVFTINLFSIGRVAVSESRVAVTTLNRKPLRNADAVMM